MLFHSKPKLPLNLSIEQQLDKVAIEISRRVLASTRQVFSIVEWTTEYEPLRWPCKGSFENEHFAFLNAIGSKLPSNGVWCVVDNNSGGLQLNLHLTRSKHYRSNLTNSESLSREMGKLVQSNDEAGVCRLITILSNEFSWLGFLVRRTNPSELAVLLRHTEIVFAAIDQKTIQGPTVSSTLRSWQDARIPVSAAFLIGAAWSILFNCLSCNPKAEFAQIKYCVNENLIFSSL